VAPPYASAADVVSSALLTAADWTDTRPPAPAPAAWLELRDTASAIRLAVQILRGPYAMLGDGEMQARAREVLMQLESSTRQLCDLLATVQPPANDAGPARAAASTEDTAAPPPSTPPSATRVRATPIPRLRDAAPASAPALSAVRAPAAAKATATGSRTLDVNDLLARLELVVGTRAISPLVLTVAAAPKVALAIDGAELLRTLVLMIEDVAPQGGSADVRVFLDPTEDLGDAMDVVFEVRSSTTSGAPTASPALRSATEGLGGRLVVRRTSTASALALRLSSAPV
jgi:hypothetical protein